MKYKKGKLWKIPTLVVCAVLFGLLAADISGSYVTAPIDVAAYHILRSFESSAATGFFKIMTNMVHPVVLLVDMPWWQRHFMDFLHICLSRQT